MPLADPTRHYPAHSACYGKRSQPALDASLRKLPPAVSDVQSGGVFEGTKYEPAGVRTRLSLAPRQAFSPF